MEGMLYLNNDLDYTLLIIGVTVILLLLTTFIVTFLLIYKNRHEKHQAELQRIKNVFEEELFKSQLEIQEQTLKNISSELHDNVGQLLSLANLELSNINLDNKNKAGQLLQECRKLVSEIASSLRNLTHSMHTDYLNQIGLPAALEFELIRLENTGRYKTAFKINGTACRMDEKKEIILYRIAQELINNIIKHAEASYIEIIMNYSDEALIFTVRDDGKGFNTGPQLNKDYFNTGVGLKNIANRANLINATLNIKSEKNSGSIVTIEMPCT